jgi:hypothetical protein
VLVAEVAAPDPGDDVPVEVGAGLRQDVVQAADGVADACRHGLAGTLGSAIRESAWPSAEAGHPLQLGHQGLVFVVDGAEPGGVAVLLCLQAFVGQFGQPTSVVVERGVVD